MSSYFPWWDQSSYLIFTSLKVALKFISFKESRDSLGFVRKTFLLSFFGLTSAIISLVLLNAINNGYPASKVVFGMSSTQFNSEDFDKACNQHNKIINFCKIRAVSWLSKVIEII